MCLRRRESQLSATLEECDVDDVAVAFEVDAALVYVDRVEGVEGDDSAVRDAWLGTQEVKQTHFLL